MLPSNDLAGRCPRGRTAGAPRRRASRGRLAAAALCGGVLVVAACTSSPGDEEIASAGVPTITARTDTVKRHDLVDWLEVWGTVAAVPNQDVKISALVGGRVVALRVAEGDAVRAGQVVAELDPQPLRDQRRQASAALDQARAALENARLNLDRTAKLYERGIAAGKEVEDARTQQSAAEAAVEQAVAGLDLADRQVSRTRVTSPIAGYVVKRLVSVGEQVDGTAAEPLLEVANIDAVELGAVVPATHLSRVQVGQRVEAFAEAYPGRAFGGHVVAISPAVDSATNGALARLRLPNGDHQLKVGLSARARIALGARPGALIVPPSAISRGGAGAAVYVVTGGVAQRTAVATGLETADAVEILSGVTEGQTVLTSAIHGLGERARLAPAS